MNSDVVSQNSLQNLAVMTLRQLRQIASDVGVSLYSRKSKEELVEAITTLQGDTLTITKNGDQTLVNGIPVVVGDVAATNGVVHVISGVLVPG